MRLFLLLASLAFPAWAGPSVEVAFSPGSAADAVVRVIDESNRSVRVAGYGFTSAPIAKALVAASRRGVDVRVVLDKSNHSARYSAVTFLANNGIPVRINSRYAIMHSKYVIVDSMTVETGSMNFTKSGQSGNAENILILREYPEVAARYTENWNRLWNEGRGFQGK